MVLVSDVMYIGIDDSTEPNVFEGYTAFPFYDDTVGLYYLPKSTGNSTHVFSNNSLPKAMLQNGTLWMKIGKIKDKHIKSNLAIDGKYYAIPFMDHWWVLAPTVTPTKKGATSHE